MVVFGLRFLSILKDFRPITLVHVFFAMPGRVEVMQIIKSVAAFLKKQFPAILGSLQDSLFEGILGPVGEL